MAPRGAGDNGRPMPSGVYFVRAEVRGEGGVSVLRGRLTLIR